MRSASRTTRECRVELVVEVGHTTDRAVSQPLARLQDIWSVYGVLTTVEAGKDSRGYWLLEAAKTSKFISGPWTGMKGNLEARSSGLCRGWRCR